MPNASNRSLEMVDDAISSLRRLRNTLEHTPAAVAPAPVSEQSFSIAAVEGQSWGAPVLGFMRVTLGFGDAERYTFWTFNFWKFSFAVHIPSKKHAESGNDGLAQWFYIERERIFESSLADLLGRKKRKEAIELVRAMRNFGTKQAMEFVDARATNKALAGEHLTKLNDSVKVSDRINEEYKEMHGEDRPLQAR